MTETTDTIDQEAPAAPEAPETTNPAPTAEQVQGWLTGETPNGNVHIGVDMADGPDTTVELVRAENGTVAVVHKAYADGTVATGTAPLPEHSPAEQEESSLLRALHAADAEAGLGYVLNRQDIEGIAALVSLVFPQDEESGWTTADDLVAAIDLYLDAEHAAPVLPAGVARFVDAAAALLRTSGNTLITAMLADDADVVHVHEPLHGVTSIEDARALPLADPERLAMHFVGRRPNEITTFKDTDGSIRTVVVQAGQLAKA